MNEMLCKQLADIVGGKTHGMEEGGCSVEFPRPLSVSIMGRPARSAHVLNAELAFAAPDAQGRTLNLGEFPLLQEEVNPFLHRLQSQGIMITALHNHWLFDQPALYYLHFMSVEPPLQFAHKVAHALHVLRR